MPARGMARHLSYPATRLVTGSGREVHPALSVVADLFVVHRGCVHANDLGILTDGAQPPGTWRAPATGAEVRMASCSAVTDAR